MHDARAVANWLIERARESGQALTPLQLIKLVYFAHGWTLAFFGHPLFKQRVEAWPYGPVIADVYHEVKRYRADSIDSPIDGVPEEPFFAEEVALLEELYEKYGHVDGIRLSTLTHHDGSPWDVTVKERGQGTVIPNDLIQSHFEDIAMRHQGKDS